MSHTNIFRPSSHQASQDTAEPPPGHYSIPPWRNFWRTPLCVCKGGAEVANGMGLFAGADPLNRNQTAQGREKPHQGSPTAAKARSHWALLT